MEYPTLITTGAHRYAPCVSREIETVTVHELAHQWFYGLVATDERAAPLLDEGMTTWAEGMTMSRLFGEASAIHLPGLEVSGEAIRRAYAAAHTHDDVAVQPAPQFDSFSSIGALVYAKTATTLRTLANVYGEERVERALGEYAREYRFEHPTWEDLTRSFERHLGKPATTQLRLALEERGFVNFVARRPHCRTLDSGDDRADQLHRCVARVIRHGTLTFPVDVALIFEDGSHIVSTWDGHGNGHTILHEGPRPVIGVVVDPGGQIALDENLLDNAASSRTSSSIRTVEHTTYLAQVLLGWLGP
jgi:hypothetical protein